MICNSFGAEVVVLRGTPFEMGVVHGSLLKNKILLAIEEYLPKCRQLLGLSTSDVTSLLQRVEPFFPQWALEEIDGIASTAGVQRAELIFLNCLPDIFNVYSRGQAQCCNFVMLGLATPDGTVIHGRNLDFPHLNLIHRCCATFCRVPADLGRRAHLDIGWGGFVGCLTGVSESAITIAESDSMAEDSRIDGVPIGLLLREVLEQCSDIDSTKRFIEGQRRNAGYNIAVTDGKCGDAIAIEFTRKKFATRRARSGILVVDNPCLCTSTSRLRIGYYWGAFRHARLASLTKAVRGHVDELVAQGILRDRYDIALDKENGKSFRCVCNPQTVQSVIFLPDKNRALIAHGRVPAPTGPYVCLDLEALWHTYGALS